MSVWGRIFARLYDHMAAKTEQAGLGAHRQALLAAATGDVLEIGAGTGANLAYYGDGVRNAHVHRAGEADGPPSAKADRQAPSGREAAARAGRGPAVQRRQLRHRRFRRWCCAPSTTSPAPCASCDACCGRAGGCCSSSTCARRREARAPPGPDDAAQPCASGTAVIATVRRSRGFGVPASRSLS